VRSLATDLDAPMGDRSLTWDARGNGGQPLPDGVYTLTVASTDPLGNVSSGTATLTIDNSAPVATLATPAEVRPDQDVIVSVADAGSGVDQVASETDPAGAPDSDPFGYRYGTRPAGPVQFTVDAPYDDWKLGRHVVRVYTSDNAGNRSSQDIAFTASTTAGTKKPSTPTVTPTPKNTWRSCGNIGSRKVFNLRTWKGPSCATAKTVARKASGRKKRTVSGYKCRRTSSTYNCRHGSRVIRWDRRR
jgi:hypothetical protein